MTNNDKKLYELVSEKCSGNTQDYDFENIIPRFYTLDEDTSTESVCGADERTRVTSTTTLPYKAICKLYMRTKTGKNYVGTGWLTHGNKLYTAGHCVYSHNEGGWMDSIIVVPGKSNANEPYGRYTATNMIATNGWINNSSERFDMGAIKLSRNVSHNDYLTPSVTDSNSGTVCGYPADRDNGNFQYRMRDTIRKQNDRFFYQIDTFGGQSGAPLLSNGNTSIGIHNYGGCDNSASDLYAGFIDHINKW